MEENRPSEATTGGPTARTKPELSWWREIEALRQPHVATCECEGQIKNLRPLQEVQGRGQSRFIGLPTHVKWFNLFDLFLILLYHLKIFDILTICLIKLPGAVRIYTCFKKKRLFANIRVPIYI